MFRTTAFSLIELLVVITIIIVLLALLAPALDRAIYQAEMALCAATQRGLASSISVYAMDFRRVYPGRYGHEQWNWIEMNRLSAPTYSSYDLRPTIRTHVDIDRQINCPFSERVPFADSEQDTSVYANFAWWFGSGYTGQRGMWKVGDRFTSEMTGRRRSYNLMLGDYDVSEAQSSHPDGAGVYTHQVWVNSDAFSGLAVGAAKITASMFKGADNQWGTYLSRGPVDLNFTYQDLSVSRVNQVLPNDAEMDRVPHRLIEANGLFALVPPGQ